MKHYVFHDGQITEHAQYPGITNMPHGAYMYTNPAEPFGLVNRISNQWSVVHINTVPKEFLTQLLLLGVPL